MSLRPGSTVLHYRIERRLGAGGMGEVYLASDTTLNRSVAIKFLATPDDERARKRLLREARAAAGLDHPGVCAVYEVGTDTSRGDFVVMQYVEGETLADRLRRGRLDPAEALHLAAYLTEALRAAHEHGIVHRDVKPQNIILMPSGQPKLLDFGLAKHKVSQLAAAEAPTTAALTQPYAILGTPGYQAPEQIRNGMVDQRTDVFALGCVLYECLTGQRAFPGPTSPEMLAQVLQTDPPPPSAIVPGLAPGYDSLCARLLAKDARQRCQSADEALGAIRALLPTGTSASDAAWRSTRSSGFRWRPSRWTTALGVSVTLSVILVAVGVSYAWRIAHRLPRPSAAAQSWYNRGVGAIREGAYAGAKASFEEAITLDPRFAQAYARLADARRELDDENGAQQALLHVNELVPDSSLLDPDDRLRLEAVRASVLGEHDQAIASYKELANKHQSDAAMMLDLGRAQEAADRMTEARASYMRAILLDGQYAPAYARVGSVQGTPTAQALAQLDEAVRLYTTAADVEGKAEALVRKGVILSSNGRWDDARQTLNEVIALSADPRYASQRLRANFELARVTAALGHPTEAEALGRTTVDEAVASGWDGIAANGLVDLGGALQLDRQPEAAGQSFDRAITLAAAHGATRTQMRAQLSKASLREFTGFPNDAIALCQAPLKFFAASHYARLEDQAKIVLSRADVDLEHYEEAAVLSREVLASAESVGNEQLQATALTSLSEELTALGRLPESVDVRNRIVAIYRRQNDEARLPYALVSTAELLVNLGRSVEAAPLLEEVERGIQAGIASYKSRTVRVIWVRALKASQEKDFAQALTAERLLAGGSSVNKSDADTALWIAVLLDHARAALNRATAPLSADKHRLAETDSPELRRALTYWVADTLRLRGDYKEALEVLDNALAEPGGRGNFEEKWRLEAMAAKLRAGSRDGGSMHQQAQADLQRLGEQWGGATKAYLERPDLKDLQRALH